MKLLKKVNLLALGAGGPRFESWYPDETKRPN